MANSKNTIVLVLLVGIIAIGAGIWLQNSHYSSEHEPEFEKLIVLPHSKPLVPTEFTTHTGQPFPSSQFAGKWSLLFFGFTHCPDICPTTLHTLAQVKKSLLAKGQWEHFQVMMISVDPRRDTPERLAQYVPFFDQEFIGLTAAEKPLTEFAKKLGILFVAREADAHGNYDVDHSAALILLNPQGQMAGVISAPHKVDEIASDLSKLARYAANSKPLETTTAKPSAITVSNAWIRPAPPGADTLAAYMTLDNKSQEKRVLIGAEGPIFSDIMIHGTSMTDGVASMSHLEDVSLAANSSLTFAPMGMHLMLMEPERDLSIGDQIPLRLRFKDGTSVDAVFTVQQPTDEAN